MLGHAAIARAVAPVGVATGEHAQNRVIFKQLLQQDAIRFCQIDACRLAGVNEVVAVLLLAAKFGVPVCPHAGGVGLCELVPHLAAFDYVALGGELDDRVVEYVDHLHEHFVDPCVVERARYRAPSRPGYSAEMRRESIARHTVPGRPGVGRGGQRSAAVTVWPSGQPGPRRQASRSQRRHVVRARGRSSASPATTFSSRGVSASRSAGVSGASSAASACSRRASRSPSASCPPRRDVEGVRAAVAAGAALEQAVGDEALDDLGGPGLGDAEHAVERLRRLARVGGEVDEGGRRGPAEAEALLQGAAQAVGRDEDGRAEQVGQAVARRRRPVRRVSAALSHARASGRSGIRQVSYLSYAHGRADTVARSLADGPQGERTRRGGWSRRASASSRSATASRATATGCCCPTCGRRSACPAPRSA